MTRLKTKDDWRREMGLTKHDYEARRVATLNHIRLKWTNRSELDSTPEEHRMRLKEHLRPLVKRYPPAKKEIASLSEAQRLENYTAWAFQINNQSRDEIRGGRKWSDRVQHPDADTEILTQDRSAPRKERKICDAIMDAENQASDEKSIKQNTKQSKADPLEPSTSVSASTLQISGDATPSKNHSMVAASSSPITAVDWDDIEVAVDATILGVDITWLPMINLKPDSAKPCHWKDFDIKTLLINFERDTGEKIDLTLHEFIYDKFAFSRQGGYSIALKRFVALGEKRGETLHLRVGSKNKVSSIADGRRMNTPESTIVSRRSRGE